MDLSFTFEQILAIGMFSLAFLGFMFGVLKFFSTQLHTRIGKVEKEIHDRIENIEENYAQRTELTNSVDNIKDLLGDMKTEYQRINDRMDDMLKWMMTNLTGKKNDTGMG